MRIVFAVILCIIGSFAVYISNPGSAILFFLTAFFVSPFRRMLWQKAHLKPMTALQKMIMLFVMLLASFLTLGIGGDSGLEDSEDSSSQTSEGTKESGMEVVPLKARGSVPSTSELTVHYIDVGQGDATLLVCDGETMLIDAGDNSQGTAIQSYLNHQGIDRLDYVIGTHPDEDHVGGLDVIITKFDCGSIFLPAYEKDTRTYEDVLQAIRYKGYQSIVPQVGDTYTLGTATVTFIAPNRDSYESVNDGSIGIIVEYGETRFLFTGDAQEASEADMLENGIDLDADVYKVAHHGSKTSSSEAFLDAVSPEYAVISCGEGNSYGHPHAAVMNSLRAAGVKVFRTDEQGTLVCTSDGTTLRWNCSPSQTWQAGEPIGSSEPEESREDMVHITRTGTKYHQAGCRYLDESDIEIRREDALARGYEPCGFCKP